MKIEEAFEKLLVHEGFYSNDPDDLGGETIYGISRKNWPVWTGWSIVDSYKNKSNFIENLKRDMQLKSLCVVFYKKNFWDVNDVELITDDKIQYELFDTGVNTGTVKAAMFFQEALNLCNRNQQDYPDLKVDGDIGLTTLSAFLKCRKDSVYKTMNLLQGEYYMNITRNKPVQEKYFNGWLNRVTIAKE